MASPQYSVVDIAKIYERKNLNKSLIIPSSVHSYSLCIEYMQRWFMKRFRDNYFKTVYIEGSKIFNDYRRMSKQDMIKRLNPAVVITPTFDETYNRNEIDSNMFGIDLYIKRSKYEDSFFKDNNKNVFLAMTFEAIQMSFNFKIRLNSRAEQLDLIKYMKSAYRIGFTQGEDVDMDFILPYRLMLNMAIDAGFKVENDKITDIINFIRYMNMNSQLPVLYKRRNINARDEFFVRMKDIFVHIKMSDISKDDGEKSNQVDSNFIVEMNAICTFPAPQYFLYYSEKSHDDITIKDTVYNYLPIRTVSITDIPKVNDIGWNLFITTEYEDLDLSKNLIIDFTNLFDGNDIGRVIAYNKKLLISPNIFLNIKLFNTQTLIETTMDWDTLIMQAKYPVKEIVSYIAIYVDLDYFNETISKLDDSMSNRLN